MLETPEEVVRIVSRAVRALEVEGGRLEALQLLPDQVGKADNRHEPFGISFAPNWQVTLYLPDQENEGREKQYQVDIVTSNYQDTEQVVAYVTEQLTEQMNQEAA